LIERRVSDNGLVRLTFTVLAVTTNTAANRH